MLDVSDSVFPFVGLGAFVARGAVVALRIVTGTLAVFNLALIGLSTVTLVNGALVTVRLALFRALVLRVVYLSQQKRIS